MANLIIKNKLVNVVKAIAQFLAHLPYISKTKLTRPMPQFGSVKGMFKMKPDFDEPLDDFKEYI